MEASRQLQFAVYSLQFAVGSTQIVDSKYSTGTANCPLPTANCKLPTANCQPFMYTLFLKNEKLGSYNKLGLFILLLHILYFTGYFLKINSETNFIAVCVILAISLLGFMINVGCAFKNKGPVIAFSVLFVILGLIWLAFDSYWMIVPMVILAYLDFNVRKIAAVYLSEHGIEIKAFPGNTHEWKQMSNVILKDRILTLDFKNDRLIQTETDERSWGVEEEGFNLFCSQHLIIDN